MPSKKLPTDLLSLLMDGKVHSGEEIGQKLNLSRAAIWKQVRKIESLGIQVISLKGQGYQLIDHVDLLDVEVLRGTFLREYGIVCELFDEIDSTNSELMRRIQAGLESDYQCILAELQTAGRGRRGRGWVSPFARNIYFSLSWKFNNGAAGIEGLSLAVGVSIAEALRALGYIDVCVKWPNDILCQERKLAGILLEMFGEPTGICHVVIGIGVNVHKSEIPFSIIDQPWIALDEIMPNYSNRTALLLNIFSRLIPDIRMFEQSGLDPFLNRWRDLDAYYGKNVMVQFGNECVLGCASGVNNSGELLLNTTSGLRRFNSGEVSLRLDL